MSKGFLGVFGSNIDTQRLCMDHYMPIGHVRMSTLHTARLHFASISRMHYYSNVYILGLIQHIFKMLQELSCIIDMVACVFC